MLDKRGEARVKKERTYEANTPLSAVFRRTQRSLHPQAVQRSETDHQAAPLVLARWWSASRRRLLLLGR